jgi:hypothetical protein
MAHAMRASDRFDHIQLACLCIYFFLFALFLRGSTRFYEFLRGFDCEENAHFRLTDLNIL